MASITAALPESSRSPRWLHRWAVLTVCATLPLLVLGAEVTTKQVGMVDSVGFREPWHLFQVWQRALREVGFLIEHSHRLVGFVVGTCVIVLAAGLWLREPRRAVRWLGVAALVGVCLQGLLGGFRVNLNALMGNNLALLHGCFAQLVFTLLVSLAWLTSRTWKAAAARPQPTAAETLLRRWSLATAGLVYLQIVFGAIVRHKDTFLGARAHLLAAFGVVAMVAWLLKLALDNRACDKHLARLVGLLAGLLVLQLFLGVESWMSRFGSAAWRQLHPLWIHPDLLRSAHYLVGSLLFATSVVVALQAHGQTVAAGKPAPVPAGFEEGAA